MFVILPIRTGAGGGERVGVRVEGIVSITEQGADRCRLLLSDNTVAIVRLSLEQAVGLINAAQREEVVA
jgi:hypothetical protein